MKTKKLFCIIGTRPQLIKHAVLLKQLEKSFEVTTVNTAQHYDANLNGKFLDHLYKEAPIHQLDLEKNLPPAQRLGAMIQLLAAITEQVAPHAVLVYGDTDTTLAGALTAKKWGARLIHIEAGERSHNHQMPEEQNRIVTDALADILFCASQHAVHNLQKEGQVKKVVYSGDVMKDLLLQTAEGLHQPITPEPYYFCTLHRNYNQTNKHQVAALLQVLQALNGKVYFALHPATAQTVQEIGGNFSNIEMLPPQDYFNSICLQKFAQAIITDSGGIQKEAYWLMRPCITVRKETEWVETLEGKWNQLVYDELHNIPQLLQAKRTAYKKDLYGNGEAANIICSNLATWI